MLITTEIDFYSASLPIAEASAIVPRGQRVRIENTSNWGFGVDLEGLGLHVMEEYPSTQDVLGLSQEVDVTEQDLSAGIYKHTVEIETDWEGLRYIVFVYQVPAPNILDPNNSDIIYYPVRIETTVVNPDITNVVFKQNALVTDIFCTEKEDPVVCVDVPVGQEVIYVLKNLTTGERQEVNVFVDDLMSKKGVGYLYAENVAERCLTIPLSELTEGDDHQLTVIANDTSSVLDCLGECLDTLLTMRIVDVNDFNMVLELAATVSGSGEGSVRDAWGIHAVNTPYQITTNGTFLYLIITFKSDLGCVYRREHVFFLPSPTPSASFDIYPSGFQFKAKDIRLTGLIPLKAYDFHYSFNGTAGTVAVVASGLGTAEALGDFATIVSGPIVITSHLEFDAESCPSKLIEPNSIDPVELNTISIDYDASGCLEGLEEEFELCVDPGSVAGGGDPEANAPQNNNCDKAFIQYVAAVGTTYSGGTTIGATLSTPTTVYTPGVLYTHDVWIMLKNYGATNVTKDLIIEGNTAIPLNDFQVWLHDNGEECTDNLNGISVSPPGTLGQFAGITVLAGSHRLIRIMAKDNKSGNFQTRFE